MKIATWNVNSVRARLAHAIDWLGENRPDALCLQETKTADDQFPLEAFEKAGYGSLISGQKAYNGVSIHYPTGASAPRLLSAGFEDDPQKRLIAADFGGVKIVNVYVPQGEAVDSPKFQYKKAFLRRLIDWMKVTFEPSAPLAIVGDFNIAPDARDLHAPDRMEGAVMFHPDEHALLAELTAWGLGDAFRKHHEEGGLYSWWDYRMNSFKRNLGWRLDHILATPSLLERCASCEIDKTPRAKEKPSDHAPTIAVFDL